jgi:two-component system, NarL family, invasion response regulator UvrY
MNQAVIKVMLVDDHAVVRSGFRRFLEEFADIRVVAEAESGEQAYRRYIEIMSDESGPDVLVLDISMPDTSGLALMQRLFARAPDAQVIVFSMHQDAAMAERAMDGGARGYVTKSSAPEVLVKAVREVAAGHIFLSDDIAQAMARSRFAGQDSPLTALSTREFEIFQQLVGGRAPAEIARALNLSNKTIANYHTLIKQKLGVGSDIELMRIALQQNLIAP